MDILTVCATNQDFASILAEFSGSVVETDDLGRADEGEVSWVEDYEDVLSFIVGKSDFLELSIWVESHITGCGECRSTCQSACKTSCTVGNQSCERISRENDPEKNN